MKRDEPMAWGGVGGLVVVAGICLTGGVLYHSTFFWAGMIVALAQALVVGLAAWGLSLSRQAAELAEIPAMAGRDQSFAMTFGDAPAAAKKSGPRTLDLGFQRVLVGLTAAVLLGLSTLIFYLIYATFAWARANPDKPFPVAGPFDKPFDLDELALVMGVGAAAIYLVMGWLTRGGKRGTIEGEATESNFALGALGFIALAAAALLGYFFKMQYVSELAAGLMAGLLALQGVELLVNSMRSYSGVEELDQEAVDLQALPLVPMLSSFWLGGVKMLLAQSVGLASERQAGERGVIARLMPRVLAAVIVLAIGLSCLRVVPAGRVGVLERLGKPVGTFAADGTAQPDLLAPGLHFTLPWPIDSVVEIPTAELQYTDVGKQLHTLSGGGNLAFSYWTVGEEAPKAGEYKEDEFVTGDMAVDQQGRIVASPQLLETYVGVWWRVKDPVKFYNDLSHSDFYEKASGETTALPIYAALVQQSAAYAVTRTFAIHPLEQILIKDRAEVNDHCRQILQDKLDEAGAGIEIVDLTIKDLHPPFGNGITPAMGPNGTVSMGPAFAFENVVAKLEYAAMVRDQAQAYALGQRLRATGEAAGTKSKAEQQRAETVARAQGESARLQTMMSEISGSRDAASLTALAETNAFYAALREAINAPSKVLQDPRIKLNVLQLPRDAGATGRNAAAAQ
jgi:regulator of protease activity HflC (stomatin/prohibitin superfamily)